MIIRVIPQMIPMQDTNFGKSFTNIVAIPPIVEASPKRMRTFANSSMVVTLIFTRRTYKKSIYKKNCYALVSFVE